MQAEGLIAVPDLCKCSVNAAVSLSQEAAFAGFEPKLASRKLRGTCSPELHKRHLVRPTKDIPSKVWGQLACPL